MFLGLSVSWKSMLFAFTLLLVFVLLCGGQISHLHEVCLKNPPLIPYNASIMSMSTVAKISSSSQQDLKKLSYTL